MVPASAQSGADAGHAIPHAPQFVGVVMSVVHPVVGVTHDARPATHAPVTSQRPATQRAAPGRTPGSALQFTPQPPQFAGSFCRSTHAPAAPQHDCPVGHAHAHRPATHAWPAAQAFPHAPQWFRSVCVSTHAPAAPQQLWPVGHEHAQRPRTQA